jgi:hypothetical protein
MDSSGHDLSKLKAVSKYTTRIFDEKCSAKVGLPDHRRVKSTFWGGRGTDVKYVLNITP